MQVERLALEDFRNYEREEVDLGSGLNLVLGRNAQGKTNLLEAIYCLSGLGSPRGNDGALVRSGCERALLHGLVVKGQRKIEVDLELRPGRGTRALINKTPVPKTRALGEVAVSVFFGPDELSLVKGSPDGRRRFLDELVVKLRPVRDDLRREWERVLKQRNALLKSAPRGGGSGSVTATLEVWDDALVRTGAALAAARLEALAALTPYAAKRYAEVAGGGRLELAYISSWALQAQGELLGDVPDEASLRQALAAKLEEVRRHELERGISLVGPHRDDVGVALESGSGSNPMLDARAYASQGDQRTSALSLKLAEHDLLTDALGDPPVLLLDDVFSELDPHRREWLKEAVRGRGQTLLSSAEEASVDLAGADRVIEVVEGRIKPHG